MEHSEVNDTDELHSNYTVNSTDSDDYIYDRTNIRVIFFSLHTIVFCLCFFGNLLVIVVVQFSRRLKTITNYFLANLAVADFCVGIFCVYQNLIIYFTNWSVGDFLCKLFQFTNTFSYTASIMILVVICTERYFAIIYPITCKQILTKRRLKYAIVLVWISSVCYSAPKFIWVTLITHRLDNKDEYICVPNRQKYNSDAYEIVNFILMFLVPLGIMTLLYTRIAICLWKSSRQLEKQLNASTNTAHYQELCRRQSSRYKQNAEKKNSNGDARSLQNSNSNGLSTPNSSQNVLKARRGVIRMLIIVVCAFALCNLPVHARKMWQIWSTHYRGGSNFSAVFTPLTNLVSYFNSGVNPLLYAFLSRNFRRGMREILVCSVRRNRRQQTDHHRRTFSMHTGFQRQASTRSTIKANATTVTILNNDHSSECSHEV